MQADLANPPARAAAAAWFAGQGFPLPPPGPATPSPHGWRTRARLAVRRPSSPWWDARPSIGLFAAGTHVVVDIVGAAGAAGQPASPSPPTPAATTPANTPCPAHHPRLNAAAAAVATAAASLSTAIFADADNGRSLSAKDKKKKKKRDGRAAAAAAAAAAQGGGSAPPPPAAEGPPPFNPGLRYLQLTVVAPSAEAALARPPHADPEAAIQLVLVWGGAAGGDDGGQAGPRALAAALWASHGPASSPTPLLHSIAINYQPDTGNAIMGAAWEAVAGDPAAAWQVAGGAAVSTPPAAFCQASPAAFGRLLGSAGELLDGALGRHAAAGTPPAPITLADLFAGSGAVGLALAARGLGAGTARAHVAAVRAVDVNAAGGPALAAGAAALAARWAAEAPGTPPPSFQFVAAAAGEAPGDWLAGADAAVVDPPRKGLDPALLAELVGDHPPPALRALLYVACHFSSLKRDGDALIASGKWRLGGGALEVLFWGADAVEAVAVFERV